MRLYEDGVVDGVKAALDDQPWSIPVQRDGLRVLGAFAQLPELTERLVERRVPSAIITAIKRHPSSQAVETAGRMALWKLALLDGANTVCGCVAVWLCGSVAIMCVALWLCGCMCVAL